MNDKLEVRKFPAVGGYNITIVNKDDVFKTIEDNIVDKELAYAIIEQLETNIEQYVSAGEVAGIPYIGKIKQRLGAIIGNKHKDELDAAKEVMDKEQYITFKNALYKEESIRAKLSKAYKYEASVAIRQNKRQYWYFVEKLGECLADIMFHGLTSLTYSPPCEEQI